MFKIYTKHTKEAGETIFEHFRFATGIARNMFISSILLFIHGCTGGLFLMPDRYNICAMTDRMCDARDDRLGKQKESESNEQEEVS